MPADEPPSDTDSDRAEYLAERDRYAEVTKEAFRSFDETIVKLSTGSFALSIGFVAQFTPDPDATGWLGFSWICLLAGLTSTVASFLLSGWSSLDVIAYLDKRYSNTEAILGGGWKTGCIVLLNGVALTRLHSRHLVVRRLRVEKPDMKEQNMSSPDQGGQTARPAPVPKPETRGLPRTPPTPPRPKPKPEK